MPLRISTMTQNESEEGTPLTLRVGEHARALVHTNVRDVIFYLRVEGENRFRFVEINPAFAQATGLSEEQVIGKLVDEVIPEPSLSLVVSHYREAIAERRTIRWDEVTDYPSGRKYGEVSITPLIDSRGCCTGLVGTVHDVTESRHQAETIRLYAEIVRSIHTGMMVFDVVSPQPSGVTLAALNAAAERMTGVDRAGIVGRPLAEIFPASEDERLVELICDVARSGAPGELDAHRFAEPRPGVFRIKAFCLDGTEVGIAIEDVTTETRARDLWHAEQRILELVASGAKLEDTLTALVLRVEELAPPALASVLLLTADGKRLVHGAAPHLPADYNRAIDGAEIGPVGGSCGTAASLKRTVIVSDTELDPLWAPYRELASRYNLRACWSTPIEATGGRVLGTFALYYGEPRAPSHAELEIIARAVHVAGIAIQRHELDEQLRALSARLEAAREDERTNIAREIHDRVGQTLTVLKLDLSWISRRASGSDGIDSGVLLDKLKDLSHSIDALIDDVRRISAELRPGLLDDIGLGAALSWKAQQIEERTSIACSVEAALDDEVLTREVATAVYRIVEEAMTNVVRHSGATRADIRVEQADSSVVVEVRDNGKGILDEQIDDPQSFGLLGIRERARRLGGSATFGRVPSGGTHVTVELPLGTRA